MPVGVHLGVSKIKPLRALVLEECDPMSCGYKWTLTIPLGPDAAPGTDKGRREKEQLPHHDYFSQSQFSLSVPKPFPTPLPSPPPAASSWLLTGAEKQEAA